MSNTENTKDVTKLAEEELTKVEAGAVPLEDDELDAATGGVNVVEVGLQANQDGRTVCFMSRLSEGYALVPNSPRPCSCALEYKWAKAAHYTMETGYTRLNFDHSKCYNCGWTETAVFFDKKQRY